MADICIFYSEPDGKKVEALSTILTKLGWSVWWDIEIKNGSWPQEIELQIQKSKCAIVIWNPHAIRNGSITFKEAFKARELNKSIINLKSNPVSIPLPFNDDQIVANISDWDYSNNADCIKYIIESIESILGIAPKKWQGERPKIINLLGKIIKLPCFVKSLSSHETQLNPEAGIFVLGLYPEVDSLLISAYDIYHEYTKHIEEEIDIEIKSGKEKLLKDMNDRLEKLNNRGALVLLDSGNYEKSRKQDKNWTEKEYYSVLDKIKYTYAFIYDNLDPSQDIEKNINDVIKRVENSKYNSLLPIIHAPLNKKGIRNNEQLPELFHEYASQKNDSPIIAVPERELGIGLCDRVKTVMNIREKLNGLGWYQPIHILGTGNPLSILLLSAAGADFFDGLEWCRTVADRNTGFLFHYQQFEFFQHQTLRMSQFPILKDIIEDKKQKFNLKLGLHNIDFFNNWMDEVQFNIHSNKVGALIIEKTRFNGIEFTDNLKKIMPGLFQ